MALQGMFGIATFVCLAWLISENRRRVSVRTVAVGIALQFSLALLLLKAPCVKNLFLMLNRVILALQESTWAGTALVFGYLGGGAAPFETKHPDAGFILAFRALPLVLLISALSSLLFYWKVLPVVVTGFSRILQRAMRIGGAEGLSNAANIFMGMVEAPLFVRPYMPQLTRSELFSVMTCGLATIAGTVMVLYASILSKTLPDALGHILVASVINAPAAITIAKIMIPETKELTTGRLTAPEKAFSSMDAVNKGTVQGVTLMINIAAMLVVMIALVHLANLILGILPDWGGEPVTLQRVLGCIMAPVVWLTGIPWKEAHVAGQLMGTKTILNELVAYLDLSRIPQGSLSPPSVVIMTYAMCGFANPGSLGIMIGGLGTMVPERRGEIVELGFRSIVSGTMATLMTGAVVSILL
ncbi:MAG: nucleoside:proton symporter [Acidobacteria bacterium]|nr:nucleoside:proton symporter [Acidobacteriota bacterium]